MRKKGEDLLDRGEGALIKFRRAAKVSFLASSSHCHFGRQSRCFIRRKTRLYPVVIREYQLFSSPALGDRFLHPQCNPEHAGEPVILDAPRSWL